MQTLVLSQANVRSGITNYDDSALIVRLHDGVKPVGWVERSETHHLPQQPTPLSFAKALLVIVCIAGKSMFRSRKAMGFATLNPSYELNFCQPQFQMYEYERI